MAEGSYLAKYMCRYSPSPRGNVYKDTRENNFPETPVKMGMKEAYEYIKQKDTGNNCRRL
jgi:hypothetical protein